MEWMIICIVVVAISCFFIGFCIRRSNNNRQNISDEVLINDSNNRQNESDVLKDLSISHSSYQIDSFGKSRIQNLAISKTNFYQINSFGKSRIQNLTISKTNLIINNNIVSNIIDDLKRDNDKRMSVFRQPGIFRQRLEELEKIEKQEIEKMKQRLSRRDRKIKSKIKDMPAPEPIYEDVKEDAIKKLDK